MFGASSFFLFYYFLIFLFRFMFGIDFVFCLLFLPECSIIRDCSRSFVGESSVCSIGRVHICSRCVHFQLSEFELAIGLFLFALISSLQHHSRAELLA